MGARGTVSVRSLKTAEDTAVSMLTSRVFSLVLQLPYNRIIWKIMMDDVV